MSASRSVPPADSPEVIAVRKRARGETLTSEEHATLARVASKPVASTVAHAEVMRELTDRKHRGE